MSEFGGLRKHENTQYALVGLGNAALALSSHTRAYSSSVQQNADDLLIFICKPVFQTLKTMLLTKQFL